jgi:hypothetical protein
VNLDFALEMRHGAARDEEDFRWLGAHYDVAGDNLPKSARVRARAVGKIAE